MRNALVLMMGLLLIASLSGIADAATEPVAQAVGGGDYFYCGAFQVVKIVGLFSGNVGLVAAGAIGGGLSCGMGW